MPDIISSGVPLPVTIDPANGAVNITADLSAFNVKDASGVVRAFLNLLTGTAGFGLANSSGASQISASYDSTVGPTFSFGIDFNNSIAVSLNLDPTTLLLYKGVKITRSAVYDFATLGGAVSSIPLTLGALPKGFIVDKAYIDVITPLTGGAGATAALTTGQGANDLVIATVVAGAPWSSTGIKATIPVGTAASAIKMTADQVPAIVVGVNALTAGKFYVHFEGHASKTT